jgi:hypothetical protein
MSIIIFIAPLFIARFLGIVLRRYKIGTTTIAFLSKWWLPLFMFGMVATIMGITYLGWLQNAVYVFAMKMSVVALLQAFTWQMIGMVVPHFQHKFKLPSKENYVLKGDYILPFKGKWTVVNGGLTKKLSHSWSIPAQRYAYDFVIVDDEGKSASEDWRSFSSYYCYDQDIIAPADGEVVALYDKYKDTFVDGVLAYCDSGNIAGNYIVIKHNDSEYSAIAHLVPHSIKVKKGDFVKQGQVIAKCGNSGNSSEPHIHYQLQSGKSFFLSAGLPIVFSDIKASQKENYSVLDARPCEDNLHVDGNKSSIARGLEVENG